MEWTKHAEFTSEFQMQVTDGVYCHIIRWCPACWFCWIFRVNLLEASSIIKLIIHTKQISKINVLPVWITTVITTPDPLSWCCYKLLIHSGIIPLAVFMIFHSNFSNQYWYMTYVIFLFMKDFVVIFMQQNFCFHTLPSIETIVYSFWP